MQTPTQPKPYTNTEGMLIFPYDDAPLAPPIGPNPSVDNWERLDMLAALAAAHGASIELVDPEEILYR